MKIKADKQGIQVLEQLCDLALKSGGIKNFLTIKAIIESVEEIKCAEGEGSCGTDCSCN